MIKRTVVMAVLDGWGIGRGDNSNPIHVANPQYLDYIKRHYLAGTIQASGIAVGLPWGEEGNSEVGHLTLGAGKVLYQHYPRISLLIRDGNFFKNEVLLQAVNHTQANDSNLHLVGLLTEGNVHSSLEHLQALLKLADEEGVSRDKLFLHLFTDGRDSSPQSALTLLSKLGQVKIATISGRFYAMDRERIDRAKAAYDVIVGHAQPSHYNSAKEAIEDFYKRNYTDEYIEPVLLDQSGTIKSGDSVVFFNFREDRMRQLVSLFASNREKDTYICTFTKYSDKIDFPAAFPPDKVINPLGKVLSDNGLTQLRIAETEKYAHVTFFFNGLHEPPYPNEFRVLIPSRNVSSHDQFPEMRAPEITERALAAISERGYNFILVNYANGDMVAHTGNFDAAVKAVKTVDEQIGILLKAIRNTDSVLIITSDHGNIERMMDPQTGLPETKHDLSPVPIYVVANEFERTKDDFETSKIEKENIGVLGDVAPTILELLDTPKPQEMMGISLLKLLR
jgi:2,3-bisphosphoglycerate-independent phosphoglycerate mutase